MTRWALIDDEGCVVRAGQGPAAPPGALVLPEGVTLEGIIRQHFDGARWRPRPKLPEIEQTASGLRVSGLPEGARLELFDAATGEEISAGSKGGRIELDLADTGVWSATLSAPKPYLPREQLVVRGEGRAAIETMKAAAGRERAVAQVNEASGRIRRRYVTDIPGQEMLYLEKRSEALRYAALPEEPDSLEDYPLIAAEVGITAPTAWQVAQIWLHQSAYLVSVAAALESARLGAVAAIEAARTPDEIDAALAAFNDRVSRGIER